MNSVKVTIIVPCYKQAHFLDECLQSIINQTFTDWECIVINDGSPDNTEEVVNRWIEKDKRISYLEKKNGGLSSARNYGLKRMTGEFVQFLDSDDLLECRKIENQINIFKEINDVDVLVSGYRYFLDKSCKLSIGGNEDFYPEIVIDRNDSNEEVLKLLLNKNPFVISAPLYRKSVFEKIGVFDEKLPSLEDWDFHIRAAINNVKFHHVGYSSNTKTLIRLHGESMMRNKKIMLKAREMINNKLLEFQLQFPKAKKKKSSFKYYMRLLLPPIFYKLKDKFQNA